MATIVNSAQLALPIKLPVDQHFDNYVTADNAQLIQRAKQMVRNTKMDETSHSAEQLYMHGSRGVGKSHLLYAICHYANELDVNHFYLNMNQLLSLPTAVLDGVADVPVVCIDDLHGLNASRDWQVAIFDLINQRIEKQAGLLVFASTDSPASEQSKMLLPDLQSRLSWGETYRIQSLNDHQQIEMLEKMATSKGLSFSPRALDYMIHHCDRSNAALAHLIDRLDTRSLQEQKKLSIQLIKRELGL